MKFLLVVATAIIVSVVFMICRDLAKSSRSAENSIRWTLFIGAVLIGGMWWSSAHYLGEKSESDVKVDGSIFSNYSNSQYPKTYAAWGESGVEDIKRVERLAAVKVARQRECDNVSYIGLSEKHSRPTDRIVVFADCDNGWRFYVDHNLEILESKKLN